ncbi:MAG: penicillin-binding protein [Pseudopedobacter saltans]|uniref:Penicillin-binding protein n=1 Tax=Pseudopedobacter saltans TaxID=151895 RepID=A0A2W5F824_9SPHI|nr:MAG: penicillin-binding protein [Pseudopedobacter saltans]
MFAIFFMSLGAITKHDDNKKVPDIVGKTTDEAIKILKENGLRVEIQDSVYIDSLPKSSVVKQSPDAQAVVKVNRTIFLTVNRLAAPLVDMPDLRGFSITSAQLLMQNLGLKLGGTSYINDIAKNAVKQQLMNNTEIQPGAKVPVGATIFLVLGNGAGSESMEVPDIVGMSLDEATDYLQTFKVAIGTVNADPNVTDQGSAEIYKQDPPRMNGAQKNRMKPGQAISVWLRPAEAQPAAAPQDNALPLIQEPKQH